jgi:hypothetical protein
MHLHNVVLLCVMCLNCAIHDTHCAHDEYALSGKPSTIDDGIEEQELLNDYVHCLTKLLKQQNACHAVGAIKCVPWADRPICGTYKNDIQCSHIRRCTNRLCSTARTQPTPTVNTGAVPTSVGCTRYKYTAHDSCCAVSMTCRRMAVMSCIKCRVRLNRPRTWPRR